MASFRPGQQRPRNRGAAARTLLLLLVAVGLVVLGGRRLLEQSSASLNGQQARQAGVEGSSSSSGRALQEQVDELRREKAALEAQLAELRQQVERSGAATGTAQVSAGTAAAASTAAVGSGRYLETIDISRLLGPLATKVGVSMHLQDCFQPFKETVPDAALASQLVDKLKSQLRAELAPLIAAANSSAGPGAAAAAAAQQAGGALQSVWQLVGQPDIDGPGYQTLDATVARVISRFLINGDGTRACMCGKRAGDGAKVKSANDVGTSGCKEGETEPVDAGLTCAGSFSNLLLGTNWGPDQLAEALHNPGVCTVAIQEPNFGSWWIQERLRNPEYKNFPVHDKQDDTILGLFDMMYEAHHVFLRQKWMGFTMMQDPFDLLAIQMLIFDVRPNLIIETGTANGGSALLWASVLENSDLHESRIHTIDVNDPARGFGSADADKDPTQHRLWKKYVTFHKGFSTDEAVVSTIAKAADAAKTVLVLLDSDHSHDNVAQELETYCARFVTVGSYCVVEDTKLSRLARHPGPLEAARKFVKEHPGAWKADRDRELMYSQHCEGYLKRIA